MVGVVCFGARALRVDAFGKVGEPCEIAGPFGNERFDAFVFFFFRERSRVGFEFFVDNFVLESRGDIIDGGGGAFVATVGRCVSACEFMRNEFCVVLVFSDFLYFACEFAYVLLSLSPRMTKMHSVTATAFTT